MLDKYKVFVRGSTETKEVLREIVVKLNIHVNSYEFSDNPRYQFGKCPIDDTDFTIWYTDESSSEYFTHYGYKEVTSQQFREIWLGKESSKKEKKKYLGFIGDSNVKISFLPREIKNPKSLKGTAHSCIFYVENNELTYCPIGKEPEDISFEIVSYDIFLTMLYRSVNTESRQYEKLDFEYSLTPEDCFESMQKTKEIDFVQSFVKNSSENFLQLSEEKPLKIIL